MLGCWAMPDFMQGLDGGVNQETTVQAAWGRKFQGSVNEAPTTLQICDNTESVYIHSGCIW